MNEFESNLDLNTENNVNNDSHLIDIAQDIVKMTDSVIGVIGKISSLPSDEYKIVKEWYEQLAGHEFNIVRDAIDVRKNAISYLKSKNIDVPADPTYDIEQFNPMSSKEFLFNWGNSSIDSGRGRR